MDPEQTALRLLLHAFPRTYRERHGSELLDFLRSQRREPRYRGAGGAVRFWMGAVADAVVGGLRLRMARKTGRHDTGGTTMMDGVGSDLRWALRGLGRSPGFTALVTFTLAVGIGATTAMFSVVHTSLLRPLPWDEADRLVFVWQNDRATGTVREPAAAADYFDFRERTGSFQDLAMTSPVTATLDGSDGEPVRVALLRATHNLPSLLGVEPVLGRAFTAEEDRPGGPRVALLTHSFWRGRLGGAPDLLGRTLLLDDVQVSVVGVLPEGVDAPGAESDLWIPMQESAGSAARNPHAYTVMGRLAPGVSREAAQAEMDRVAAALEAEFPANTNRGAFVEPVPDHLRGDGRRALWILLAAVGMLLLIACTNVANLLLARASTRRRDVAVLAAVGATPGRLTRRFLLEGLCVAGAAAVLGIALAAGGLRIASRLWAAGLPPLQDAGLDPAVLGFTIVLSAVVGVVFAAVPVLDVRRLDIHGRLEEGRRGSGGGGRRGLALRRGLVALQVALAVVLLVGSGLLLRTLHNLYRVNAGFEASGVLRVSYALPASRYPRNFAVWPDWPEVNAFHHELVRRVETLPGVESAAVTTNHPLDPGFTNSFTVAGREADPDAGEITTRLVTPGYLETAGLEVLDGRTFQDTDDTDTAPVVVLNQAAARRHFPDGDALGAGIRIWGGSFREIVGIVEDERVHGLAAEAPPAMYVNLFQAPPREVPLTLLVRTRTDPLEGAAAVRRVFSELDPQLALFDVRTMDETLAASVGRERFLSSVLTAFAAAALFLALLGVHGVLSYMVAQRRHEMGIRMALGASRRDIVTGIVGQGGRMIGWGVVLGLTASVALSGVVETLLFGVTPTEPVTYLAVTAALALAGLTAAALPALRASRTDPATSLRAE